MKNPEEVAHRASVVELHRLTARVRQLINVVEGRQAEVSLTTYASASTAAPSTSTALVVHQAPDTVFPLSDDAMKTLDPMYAACLLRLSLGELLEMLATAHAKSLGCVETSPEKQPAFARLLFDSYAAACWTSAHAEWLILFRETREVCSKLDMATSLDTARPDVHLLPYAMTSLPDLGVLLERKPSSRVCGKSAGVMIGVLTRCTNTGSRGWDSTLADALKDVDGCARIVTHVMLACHTGMHQCINPVNRPGWRTRCTIYRCLVNVDGKSLVVLPAAVTKECVRTYVATLLSNMPATREALKACHSPPGALSISPFEPPPAPLMIAMGVVTECAQIACARGSRVTPDQLSDMMLSRLADDRRHKQPTPKGARHPPLYISSWLGRGHSSGASRGSKAIDVVNSITLNSFKADFQPFWFIQSAGGNSRISRLDHAQHAELHDNNAVVQMVNQLDERVRMQIYRKAITDPRCGVMTLQDVADVLGITMPLAVGRSTPDMMELEAEDAAKIIAFTRVSALRANIIAYDLGPQIKRLQTTAISKRTMRPRQPGESDDAVLKRLPITASKLFICTECKRVANACYIGEGKDVAFDELGISSSMLACEGEFDECFLKCARRSSAALRTALMLEEESRKRAEGAKQPMSTALVRFDRASYTSRLRRDLKSTYDQTSEAMACGVQPLVNIELAGRAVFVYGQCYMLCCFCGCVFTRSANTYFLGFPCCCRCDAAAVSRNGIPGEEMPVKKNEKEAVCRFCGKPSSRQTSTQKFKLVPAPLDNVGVNGKLPPPLRSVHYCSSHSRPWLAAAHNVMTIQEVFAHISSKCRPVFLAAGKVKGNALMAAGAAAGSSIEFEPEARRRGKSVKRLRKKTKVGDDPTPVSKPRGRGRGRPKAVVDNGAGVGIL